jgi:hypothetical protein
LQGFIDQAKELAHDSLVDARAGDDKLTCCFVLGLAVCRIALMRGDLAAADRSTALLLDVATSQSFTRVGRSLEAMLLVERGGFAAASIFIVAIRSPFCRHERLAQSVGNGLRTPVSASSKISRGWKESSHNKGPDRRLQPPVLTYLLDFMQPFRASGNLRASAGKHNCVGIAPR